jgi:hypothetical protein
LDATNFEDFTIAAAAIVSLQIKFLALKITRFSKKAPTGVVHWNLKYKWKSKGFNTSPMVRFIRHCYKRMSPVDNRTALGPRRPGM